jgi:hypothetical protein
MLCTIGFRFAATAACVGCGHVSAADERGLVVGKEILKEAHALIVVQKVRHFRRLLERRKLAGST